MGSTVVKPVPMPWLSLIRAASYRKPRVYGVGTLIREQAIGAQLPGSPTWRVTVVVAEKAPAEVAVILPW